MGNPSVWVVLAALVTVIGSIVGARIAARGSLKTKVLDIDAAAYERAEKINAAAFLRLEKELQRITGIQRDQGKEIDSLKTAIARITRIFEISINFTEDLLLWALDGCRGPMPHIPTLLIEHLDPGLVEKHQRQQASPKK